MYTTTTTKSSTYKNLGDKKKKEDKWEQGRIEIIEAEITHVCVLGMV